MSCQAFVDESKARGYILAAAIVEREHVDQVRRRVGRLRLPGQYRIHFAKEQDCRRRTIIDTFAAMPVNVTLYQATRQPSEYLARAACLEALVDDCSKLGAELLVLEQDDSLIESDRRLLYTDVRTAGCEAQLRYEHKRARHEPLLAVPDAVAWCWAKGGDWRRRARPIVTDIVTL